MTQKHKLKTMRVGVDCINETTCNATVHAKSDKDFRRFNKRLHPITIQRDHASQYRVDPKSLLRYLQWKYTSHCLITGDGNASTSSTNSLVNNERSNIRT